ncbi:hypothetical protein OAH35_00005, partial [bacterium]|nr:hypothetical protein [bacterium]
EWEPPQGIQFPEIGPEEELVPINEKIFKGSPPNFNDKEELPPIDDDDLDFLEDLIKIFDEDLECDDPDDEHLGSYGSGLGSSISSVSSLVTPAWYQPIHFFGHDWGIFIRLDCLHYQAKAIAREFMRQNKALIRQHGAYQVARKCKNIFRKASFYCYYLHESYHHKVESFGFRLHVARGPRYVDYKRNVYRPNFLTKYCLEESLANASSFHRLSDKTYRDRLGPEITKAAKSFLEKGFYSASPGYKEAFQYLKFNRFLAGERELQSQIIDGALNYQTNPDSWIIAKGMMTGVCNIKSQIYQIVSPNNKPVLPQPIFHLVISPQSMVKAAQLRGYTIKQGGKGSHIKMENPFIEGRNKIVMIPGGKNLSNVKYSIAKSIGYSREDMEMISKL